MKRGLVIGLMLLSATAVAGKRERDYMKNEIAPAVKDAEAKFKSGCGCALKITVKEDSYKEVSDMHVVKSMAEEVAEDAPKYCTDAESKKALCQMKTLEIAWANDVAFTFKGGKGTATTNANSRPGFDMITAELDK